MRLIRKKFGKHQDRNVDLYTFSNENGLVVSVTNFGACITSIKTPDRAGRPGNIILGYDRLEHYAADTAYIGSLVGRYANRICQGRFSIDGKEYQLTCNEGSHHLHGGTVGFNKKIWEAQPVREEHGCGLALSLISADGEEGYPGTVDVQVKYLLTMDNTLIVEYIAASDRPTVINLTQHAYFNLACSGTIHNHLLQINAAGYIPVDDELIPKSMLKSVEGTGLDFRSERRIGQAFADAGADELVEGGFDHNYVLDGNERGEKAAAVLYEPGSGRTLTVFTSQPGLQLYTGNFLNETMTGRDGVPFCKHGALCLETQHFPDSPNQRAFPSVILLPGQAYRHQTSYRFGVRD